MTRVEKPRDRPPSASPIVYLGTKQVCYRTKLKRELRSKSVLLISDIVNNITFRMPYWQLPNTFNFGTVDYRTILETRTQQRLVMAITKRFRLPSSVLICRKLYWRSWSFFDLRTFYCRPLCRLLCCRLQIFSWLLSCGFPYCILFITVLLRFSKSILHPYRNPSMLFLSNGRNRKGILWTRLEETPFLLKKIM